jgi:hypothetical protein
VEGPVVPLTGTELELRRTIFEAFAATGEARDVDDSPVLRSLAEQHVVVLSPDGAVRMAHPFAAHRDGARVDAGGRTWWGNCAWDGLGIVHALGLHDATVMSNGITIEVDRGAPATDALFHVAVPSRHWWDDIAFT